MNWMKWSICGRPPLLTWHCDGLMRPVTELLPLTLTMAGDQGWPGDIWCHASNVPATHQPPAPAAPSDEAKIAHTSQCFLNYGKYRAVLQNLQLITYGITIQKSFTTWHKTEWVTAEWHPRHANIQHPQYNLHIQIHFRKHNFFDRFLWFWILITF